MFLDGIGLNTATVLQDGNSKGTVAETQLTEIMPGKTIEVKSAYSLPDGDKKTLEAEFSQLLGKKKGILTIDLGGYAAVERQRPLGIWRKEREGEQEYGKYTGI